MPLPDFPCPACGRTAWKYASAKNKIQCQFCGCVESWQHPSQEVILSETQQMQLKQVDPDIRQATDKHPRPATEQHTTPVRHMSTTNRVQRAPSDSFQLIANMQVRHLDNPDAQQAILSYLQAAVETFDAEEKHITEEYDYFQLKAIVDMARMILRR